MIRLLLLVGGLLVLVLVLGAVVVLPVLLPVAAVLVSPANLQQVTLNLPSVINRYSRAHPGPEPVILALLVSGDVVVRVAAVPPELVLLVRRHVHVLEVAVGLLSIAADTLASLRLL